MNDKIDLNEKPFDPRKMSDSERGLALKVMKLAKGATEIVKKKGWVGKINAGTSPVTVERAEEIVDENLDKLAP